MFAWLNENLATILVVLLLAVAVFFAARHILRTRKAGGCVGCSGCSGSCPHCESHSETKQ